MFPSLVPRSSVVIMSLWRKYKRVYFLVMVADQIMTLIKTGLSWLVSHNLVRQVERFSTTTTLNLILDPSQGLYQPDQTRSWLDLTTPDPCLDPFTVSLPTKIDIWASHMHQQLLGQNVTLKTKLSWIRVPWEMALCIQDQYFLGVRRLQIPYKYRMYTKFWKGPVEEPLIK